MDGFFSSRGPKQSVLSLNLKQSLVGGIPTPPQNDGVKVNQVSWDDDIPN